VYDFECRDITRYMLKSVCVEYVPIIQSYVLLNIAVKTHDIYNKNIQRKTFHHNHVRYINKDRFVYLHLKYLWGLF